MVQLGKHFRSDDQERHSKWLRQQRWFVKARKDHMRKEEIADRLEDGVISLAAEVVMATQIQIEEFRAHIDAYETRLEKYDAKLDVYDAAVTRALMERLQRLEILEVNHADLLANAFTLEDGRRVFKSEDGTFVIDEKGQNVSVDIIEPDSIPDGFPTAEELTASFAAMDEENAEIDKLYEAQGEIDTARDKSRLARDKIGVAGEATNKEGITKRELDELEAEFDAVMPSELPVLPLSAAKYLSGVENTENVNTIKAAFTVSANPTATPQIAISPTPQLDHAS